MKKITLVLFGGLLALTTLTTACDKEDIDDLNNGNDSTSVDSTGIDSTVVDSTAGLDSTFTSLACVLLSDVMVEEVDGETETTIKTFHYNEAGHLVKITFENDSSKMKMDTIIYDAAGILQSILSYEYMDTSHMDSLDNMVWIPLGEATYTWDGANIASIVQSKTEKHHIQIDSNSWEEIDSTTIETTTLTIIDGQVGQIVTDGERGMGFYNIVWENGNIISLDMGPGNIADTAGNTGSMTLSYDDKPNSFRHDIPRPGGEILAWLTANNWTKISTATEVNFGGPIPIPTGTDILTRNLTYGSNDEVTEFTEMDLFDEEQFTSTHSLVWNCN